MLKPTAGVRTGLLHTRCSAEVVGVSPLNFVTL
jgi:hypothetical protein